MHVLLDIASEKIIIMSGAAAASPRTAAEDKTTALSPQGQGQGGKSTLEYLQSLFMSSQPDAEEDPSPHPRGETIISTNEDLSICDSLTLEKYDLLRLTVNDKGEVVKDNEEGDDDEVDSATKAFDSLLKRSQDDSVLDSITEGGGTFMVKTKMHDGRRGEGS